MRMRLLALVPVVAVALATGAHAGPTKVPQVKDPAGDAVGGQAGTDIVSVLYTSAGVRSGKAYKAKELLVTMTLAGPALTTPGVSYEATATTSACGDVTLHLRARHAVREGDRAQRLGPVGSCDNGSGNIELLTATTAGNTITWEFGIKATPFKLGTLFSTFRAEVDLTEPVVPFPASETGTNIGVPDAASGNGTWKLG